MLQFAKEQNKVDSEIEEISGWNRGSFFFEGDLFCALPELAIFLRTREKESEGLSFPQYFRQKNLGDVDST